MKERYSYNLILLGGTGARCGEIFVHMCANGYLDVKSVNMLYIDSDTKNGNAKSLERIVNIYKKCREKYVIKESPIPCFFKPKLNLMKENPVKGTKYFRDLASDSGNNARGVNSAAVLMDALYSEEEKEMKISEGFFAHPNVGVALFAANMDAIMDKFIKVISVSQKDMKKNKIFLIGSIFGGTGASSLPTISKYLKKKLFGSSDNKNIGEQLKIGGCMVLPYFCFSRDDVTEQLFSEEEIEIEADKFATKTKAALEYYKYVDGACENKEDYKVFDSLYIIGHDGKDVRGNYETSGDKQRNLPHIVEFYTAMSSVTFFESDMEERGRYFATVSEKKISWVDTYNSTKCFFCFIMMMRFAIVMKSLILEELFDYKQSYKVREKIHLIPWYYDFLDGKDKSSDMDQDRLYSKFKDISNYCSEYIRWFSELNINNIEKVKVPDRLDEKANQSEEGDLVDYLHFFNQTILLKQYMNNLITDGLLGGEYDEETKDNIYQKNLKYLRSSLTDLEQTALFTDLDMEKIDMDKIWSRLSNLGFNYYEEDDNILKNIQRATDKSMDEGIKNLVNAIFVACMI